MNIRDLLETHRRIIGQRGTKVLCVCGWNTEQIPAELPADTHLSHVAEVLEDRESGIIAPLIGMVRVAESKIHRIEELAGEWVLTGNGHWRDLHHALEGSDW